MLADNFSFFICLYYMFLLIIDLLLLLFLLFFQKSLLNFVVFFSFAIRILISIGRLQHFWLLNNKCAHYIQIYV